MNPQLTENNYVYIPGFISPQRAKTLARNFESFCNDNNIGGDEQIPISSSTYNYIDFLELLCNSTPEVGDFIGENVLPSYTYSRVYKKGAELLTHRDRDACEISLTVHLDGDKEWPIFIKNPKGETISLNLKSGDAMIYLGCEAEHWREAYDGDKYVQVFLHYVRSRGERSYAYFDKTQKKEPKVEEKLTQPTYEPAGTYKPLRFSSQNKLVDFIQVFDDIVPHTLCDDIIKEYSDYSDLTLAPVGPVQTTNEAVRKVLTASISTDYVINGNYSHRKELDQKVHECMVRAMDYYNQIHPTVKIERDSGYGFLKYDVGCFYLEHIDSFTQEPRSVSCSIALNDDYEGGEFAFFNQDVKYKIKKGSVILFPSNFMYPHEILPVTKGTRYSIVTWLI